MYIFDKTINYKNYKKYNIDIIKDNFYLKFKWKLSDLMII